MGTNSTKVQFGNVPVGNSASYSLYFAGSYPTPTHIASMSISGENAADFSLQSPCPAVLQPGQACRPSLIFQPGAVGLRSAALTITDDTAESPQTIPLSGTGVVPVPASALFQKTDTGTLGNWKGVYGLDGSMIPGIQVPVNVSGSWIPEYVTVTPGYAQLGGVFTFIWSPVTSDVRALLEYKYYSDLSRLASAYVFSGPSVTDGYVMDVNIIDGQTHQLALYLSDWDNRRPSETISILDATSQAVLDTRTVTGFYAEPQYLVWDVRGHVQIRASVPTGVDNAVINGVFFDPVSESGTAAVFQRADTFTMGTWVGIYGVDGFMIPNSSSNVPSYAVTDAQAANNSWTWAASTSDARALMSNNYSSRRIASTFYNSPLSTIYVNFTDGNTHELAIYLSDWDNRRPSETITVLDASSQAVLDTRTVTSFFSTPEYLIWNLRGQVLVQATVPSGVDNAVIDGLFFDPVGGASTAVFQGTDATTMGNWKGVYGSEGSTIPSASTPVDTSTEAWVVESSTQPSYAAMNIFPGVSIWTWAASTSDIRALLKYQSTIDRIASTFYDNGYSLPIVVNLLDGQTHQVALYLSDWDNRRPSETITILDATTQTVLDTRTVVNFFAMPQYLIWNVRGNVLVKAAVAPGGDNSVIDAIFFDPAR